MRQTNQDTLAGKIQPSQYDTILPPDARSELVRPSRPAILRRPIYQPSDRSGILKWVGGFALVAIILAAVVGHYSSQQPPTTPQPDPVLQRTLIESGGFAPVNPHSNELAPFQLNRTNYPHPFHPAAVWCATAANRLARTS
jgi:hypothetical protein